MFIWLVLLCATPKPPVGSVEAEHTYFADCAVEGAYDAYGLALAVAHDISRRDDEVHVGVQKVRIESRSLEEKFWDIFGRNP